MNSTYISGYIKVSDTLIPKISERITLSDFLGTVRVRLGIKRDNYKVPPGLYATGLPGLDSDVFVTSNYKLTFDTLRENLSVLNGWILVLDTKGVNVWCAAGKGTFSTIELVKRIKAASLDQIVIHRRVILPQLSATGVAAHKVKDETGFSVYYGPVRASDIKKFIESGYRADKSMRKVTFGFKDRIKLIPNDFFSGKYYLLGAMIVLYLISGLSETGLSLKSFRADGTMAIVRVLLGYCGGIVVTPMLLPYIPGRYFSLKGFFSGLAIFVAIMLLLPSEDNAIEIISWFFIITSISSFVAMNFTGSSTFTSLSGVKKEMKLFIPLQIGFALAGTVLQIIGKFVN